MADAVLPATIIIGQFEAIASRCGRLRLVLLADVAVLAAADVSRRRLSAQR